jgi:hypothetical protein
VHEHVEQEHYGKRGAEKQLCGQPAQPGFGCLGIMHDMISQPVDPVYHSFYRLIALCPETDITGSKADHDIVHAFFFQVSGDAQGAIVAAHSFYFDGDIRIHNF